jgi:hypothetical protein
MDLPDTKQIRQAIPGALDEPGADAEAPGQVVGEFDLEASDDGGLIVPGIDVGAAALLIATPAKDTAATQLVEVVSAGDRRVKEDHEGQEGTGGERRKATRKVREAKHGAQGMEPTSEKSG